MKISSLLGAPLLFFIVGVTGAMEYRLEYDYLGHGDDWYGRPGPIEQRLDYTPATDIPTQQGDDFGFGYEPGLVGFGQGPALSRTLGQHTSYDFRFTPLASCFEEIPPRCGQVIFIDGFELP
jgi:hypothetical protein